MRLVIHVGGIRNMNKILIIKPDGRNPIGRPSHNLEDEMG
jgi:hypothetical protein